MRDGRRRKVTCPIPPQLREPLNSVTRALIVMGNHPDQARLERQPMNSAVAAGVSHLVKISSMEAASPVDRGAAKKSLRDRAAYSRFRCGLDSLRPNYFMQNMLMYAASISRGASFALPLGIAKTAMVDARDVGEVAANVLTDQSHAGQLYQLTGPALMDFHEVAEVMSLALGHAITYVEQTPEAFRDVLAQFIHSPWQLDAVCELFAEIASGSLETPLQRRLIC